MPENAATPDTRWSPANSAPGCPRCNRADNTESRTLESACGGYEDEEYRCRTCGHRWISECPDA